MTCDKTGAPSKASGIFCCFGQRYSQNPNKNNHTFFCLKGGSSICKKVVNRRCISLVQLNIIFIVDIYPLLVIMNPSQFNCWDFLFANLSSFYESAYLRVGTFISNSTMHLTVFEHTAYCCVQGPGGKKQMS